MADILPPPRTSQNAEPDQEPKSTGRRTNELSELATFIRANAVVQFDRHLSVLLDETSQNHDIYAGNCAVQHWHEEVPCDEYERGVSLGIAWLKAHIADQGATDAS